MMGGVFQTAGCRALRRSRLAGLQNRREPVLLGKWVEERPCERRPEGSEGQDRPWPGGSAFV